jgi:outer membrane protein assembly factor BamD
MNMISKTVAAAVIVSGLILLIGGCGKRNDVIQGGADTLYERATNSMGNGNYRNAIAYFEQLEARYPFSNVTKQAQLDLVYVYYKNGALEQTVDAADNFMRENPTHPRVDYCLYMKGLSYFDKGGNILEKLFRVDMTARPPRDTQKSFNAFQELLRRFPDSEYSLDARKRMVYSRNRLALYENHVANFYIRRKAYVAAINRAKFAVENYPGAPTVNESVRIMADAYRKLGMEDLAADAERVFEGSGGS